MTAPVIGSDAPPEPEWVPEPPEPGADRSNPPPDPGAPWGRRADGTPRAKPGRRSKGDASKGDASKGDATKRGAPPRKPAGAGRRRPTRPDYRPGVTGLLSLPAGLLASAGAALGRRELVADGATIMASAPALAEGINELAHQDPRVATVLDRVLSAGPYGALLSALVPAIAQVACNHGLVRPGVMGTRSVDDLLSDAAGTGDGRHDPAR